MNEADYWARIVDLYQQLLDHRIMPLVVTDTMMTKANIPQDILNTFVEQKRLRRCRCINDNGYTMEKHWQWTSLKDDNSVLRLPKRNGSSVKEG